MVKIYSAGKQWGLAYGALTINDCRITRRRPISRYIPNRDTGPSVGANENLAVLSIGGSELFPRLKSHGGSHQGSERLKMARRHRLECF